jgi:hypothetical protein
LTALKIHPSIWGTDDYSVAGVRRIKISNRITVQVLASYEEVGELLGSLEVSRQHQVNPGLSVFGLIFQYPSIRRVGVGERVDSTSAILKNVS